ncbi:hypothetical protein HY388_01755 [Candidatus Daviesbacteria bacterium]|nr:hypothetical protein [Candidatus Daviesbacteria bacterium]
MHNYTEKSERKQQLIKSQLGAKLAYFIVWGIFEANSGCNSYKKSGKIGEELNS